jgi:hypothetical protein
MMDRVRKNRIKDWIERTEGNSAFQTVMQGAGVTEVWLGGNFAQGLAVGEHERLRLIVKAGSVVAGSLGKPMAVEKMVELKQALKNIYPRGVDISEHVWPGSPEDALEVFIANKLSTINERQGALEYEAA